MCLLSRARLPRVRVWVAAAGEWRAAGTAPADAPSLDIVLRVPASPAPAKLLVWNYNRSTLLSSIGGKDARVLVNGAVVWAGTLRRGVGKEGMNTFTLIPLVPPPAP